MLNASLDVAQKLTIDELEEDIREAQNKDYMEGRSTHFFAEITAILEYLPAGFELDSDENEDVEPSETEPLLKELSDIDEDVEDDIEADETMKWEEEEEEEEADNFEEMTSPPEE
jgi:exopolyphosphatase/pppGpp-phosphohydrolase